MSDSIITEFDEESGEWLVAEDVPFDDVLDVIAPAKDEYAREHSTEDRGGPSPWSDLETAKYHKTVAEAAQAAEGHLASEAQRESGSYRKGHIRLHGLNVAIENRKGTRRNPEWPPLAAHYGYIKHSEGKDGDHVDLFIGPHPEAELVYVIDQTDKNGKFDEHKVMLGWPTGSEAKAAYLANYTSGWKCGPITPMTMDQFKEWLESGNMDAPVSDQVSRYEAKHAPEGGVTIGGKEYPGGQFIPSEVVESATEEEKAAIEGESSDSRSPSQAREDARQKQRDLGQAPPESPLEPASDKWPAAFNPGVLRAMRALWPKHITIQHARRLYDTMEPKSETESNEEFEARLKDTMYDWWTSEDDKARDQWTQNAADVSADPVSASSKDINRAIGFLESMLRHYDRKLARGDMTPSEHKSITSGTKAEIDWYKRIVRERE